MTAIYHIAVAGMSALAGFYVSRKSYGMAVFQILVTISLIAGHYK